MCIIINQNALLIGFQAAFGGGCELRFALAKCVAFMFKPKASRRNWNDNCSPLNHTARCQRAIKRFQAAYC